MAGLLFTLNEMHRIDEYDFSSNIWSNIYGSSNGLPDFLSSFVLSYPSLNRLYQLYKFFQKNQIEISSDDYSIVIIV